MRNHSLINHPIEAGQFFVDLIGTGISLQLTDVTVLLHQHLLY